jgi:hypothetical protein
LTIGVEETELALFAAEKQLLPDRKISKCFKGNFCTNRKDSCEELFSLFWDTNPVDLRKQKQNQCRVL